MCFWSDRLFYAPEEMLMNDFLSESQRKWIGGVIAVAAIIRISTLGAYPLTDNTEARYAEVAREMVSTGNWITPQLHGEKFWSKPPLSIWATAGSMKIFGTNEFAARMPHLVFSILTLWLVYLMAVRRKGHVAAWAAVALLASSAAFFVCSSCVMTDATLVLGTTLSMTAFWMALDRQDRIGRLWGHLFFVGLGISFMAKGPVGAVLTVFPIGIWVIWKNNWRAVWSAIPCVTGMFLTIALTLPWYFAAEAHTPGFLHYFFIGEHWYRFVKPGWEGDLYGTAHAQPRGMIWLMWIMAAFPWSFLLIGSWLGTAAKWRRIVPTLRGVSGYSAYLMLWALAPMVFFSLAGNVLWTYVLPGLPAFALLMTDGRPLFLPRSSGSDRISRRWNMAGWVSGFFVPIVFGTMILLWSFFPYKGSQKYLIAQYRELRPDKTNRLIYLQNRPFSAEFYLSGDALEVINPGDAETYLKDDVLDFYVVEQSRMSVLPATLKNLLLPFGLYDDYTLLGEGTKGKKEIGVLAKE